MKSKTHLYSVYRRYMQDTKLKKIESKRKNISQKKADMIILASERMDGP